MKGLDCLEAWVNLGHSIKSNLEGADLSWSGSKCTKKERKWHIFTIFDLQNSILKSHLIRGFTTKWYGGIMRYELFVC